MPKEAKERKTGTKVLANGAVYDYSVGHIVANPGGGTAAITAETSSAYHARRQELKRQALAAAANAAAEQLSSVRGPYFSGDLAFVSAIGETMMQKAADPKDVKAVDAARFLLQETGLAEAKQAQEQPQVQRIEYGIDAETRALMLEVLEARRNGMVGVVEGEVAQDNSDDSG